MKSLAARLLTATVLATGALATPAMAAVQFDFELAEIVDGSGSCGSSGGFCVFGHFEVKNNTDSELGISIVSFAVGNEFAFELGTASTTRTDWTGTVLESVNFGPFGTEAAFSYSGSDNFIGGGQSDSNFFFTLESFPASPVIINFVGPRGVTGSCTFDTNQSAGCDISTQDVPEPVTMTLLGAGLLGLAATRRRRTA
jgi:hypothetical protein